MKPALLVIDVQKAFFDLDPVMTQSLNHAIDYINAAIGLFREKQLPVICVQHMDKGDNLLPGTEGFDTPESMHILPSDVHIHKTYGNAFNKTPLTETSRPRWIPSSSYRFLRGALHHVHVPRARRGSDACHPTRFDCQRFIGEHRLSRTFTTR